MTDPVLPVGKSFSKAAIASRFRWFGEHPRAWAATRYLVPADWAVAPLAAPPAKADPVQFLTLGKFNAPEGDASLEVRVLQLDREITAERFLRHYLLMSKVDAETITALSPAFADSLSSGSGDRGPYRSRIAVRLHGPLAFVLAATCAAAKYAGLAETFGAFVASFSPVGAPGAASIEARSRAQVGAVLGFEFPASWSPRQVPAIAGKNAVDLISMHRGAPAGLLRVKTTSKSLPTRMELQVEDALQEFGAAGVRPGALKANQPITLNGTRFKAGFMQVFEATTMAGLPQELWIVCVEDASHYVTVSLLTPDRRQDFLVWAWNRTALDVVTASLGA